MKKFLSLFILHYLRFFARLQIAKIKLLNPRLKIVGITGSAGKTSTINACEAVLKPQFQVKTTAGSNSESGIPLNILGIKVSGYSPIHWLKYILLAPISLIANWHIYDIYLVEMGIDGPIEPKNMAYLLKIIHPDIGIFLNVSSVHLQNFSFLDDIAREKAKLVNTAATAIINSADPLVKKYSQNPRQINIIPQIINIPHTALPETFGVTFGAAIALASLFDIPKSQAINRLQTNFHLSPGRSSLFEGINHSTLIDSSYNSSPLATAGMLQLLSTFPHPRIAVLGDMRELGSATVTEHQKIYRLALKSADQIITVGQNFNSQTNFKYWWQAAAYLKTNLPTNSTVLLKGSQNNIFLEELVKALLQHPSDSSKLCRQSPYWLNLKQKFKSLHPDNQP